MTRTRRGTIGVFFMPRTWAKLMPRLRLHSKLLKMEAKSTDRKAQTQPRSASESILVGDEGMQGLIDLVRDLMIGVIESEPDLEVTPNARKYGAQFHFPIVDRFLGNLVNRVGHDPAALLRGKGAQEEKPR